MGTYPKLWTYSVFRFKEYIFGRKSGIRHEMSAFFDGGVAIYAAHSWEAVFSLFEIKIRDFLKNLSFSELLPVRIWIPILQTPQGIPVFASPYLFAIAYDNSALNLGSDSFSYTVTGSNTVIFGLLAGGYADTTSSQSCTYDGASLTLIAGASQYTNTTNDRYPQQIFYKLNPSTGANTFTTTHSDATGGLVVSYSGVSQTGMPDAVAQQREVNVTGATQSITTIADNCWVLYWVNIGGGTPPANTAGTFTSRKNDAQNLLGDSGGVIHPAGNTSATFTWVSINGGTQAVSFAPAEGAVSAARHFLGLLGVGT